jgi:hypothetical protein
MPAGTSNLEVHTCSKKACMLALWNGSWPVSIRNSVMPAPHMSRRCPEYARLAICSGEMWYRLPTSVVLNMSQPGCGVRPCTTRNRWGGGSKQTRTGVKDARVAKVGHLDGAAVIEHDVLQPQVAVTHALSPPHHGSDRKRAGSGGTDTHHAMTVAQRMHDLNKKVPHFRLRKHPLHHRQ